MNGLSAYPKYRPSRDHALGSLPDHWKEPHLSHVSAVPITNGLGEAAADGDASWPRYIRTTDIVSLHKLDPNKRVTLAPSIARSAMLHAGDLLMTAAGSLGTSHLYQDDEPACYAGYLVRFRADTARVLSEYAAWWTNSRHHLDQVALGAVRSTIDNFSAGKFRSMLICLPPLAEQQAIVSYLNGEVAKIDALVAEQRSLVDLLTERRSALISHAVSGAWPTVPFVRCMTSQVDYRGATPVKVDHGVQLVTARNVRGGWIDYDTSREYIDPADYDAVMRRGVPALGDLLFTMEAPLGNVAVVDRTDIALAQRVIKWRVNPRLADPKFLMYAAMGAEFQSQLLVRATGSTALGIKASKLPELQIKLPPLDEQRRIVAQLDEELARIDALIAEAQGLMNVVHERRAALITAAVTGQIDVRGE